MPASLDTTNTILAIIAAVSVLQGLVLIAACIAGFRIYRAMTTTLRTFEEQHVRPMTAKVDAVLAQAQQFGDRLHRRADRVEAAIDDTVGRVDETATRVKSSVNGTVHRVSDAVSGIRSAIVNVLTTDPGRGETRHTQEHIREGGY